MSVSSTDKGLLTPANCAVIFPDHQPELLRGMANGDRRDLLDHLQLLAKAARIFSVPVILTAVESKDFSGEIAAQLLELFPDHKPIERSSMNAWDNPAFCSDGPSTQRQSTGSTTKGYQQVSAITTANPTLSWIPSPRPRPGERVSGNPDGSAGSGCSPPRV